MPFRFFSWKRGHAAFPAPGHPDRLPPRLPVSGRHVLVTCIRSSWLGQGLELKAPRKWELNNAGCFSKRWFPRSPQGWVWLVGSPAGGKVGAQRRGMDQPPCRGWWEGEDGLARDHRLPAARGKGEQRLLSCRPGRFCRSLLSLVCVLKTVGFSVSPNLKIGALSMYFFRQPTHCSCPPPSLPLLAKDEENDSEGSHLRSATHCL